MRQPDRLTARHPRRGPADQQAPLPRVPATPRAALGVPRPPRPGTRAARGVARAWASRSKLTPFVKLARTIHKHKAGVLAAVELGLSNARLEGLNSKIRLFSHRAYGASPPPTRSSPPSTSAAQASRSTSLTDDSPPDREEGPISRACGRQHRKGQDAEFDPLLRDPCRRWAEAKLQKSALLSWM